jgi:hypothetical protein
VKGLGSHAGVISLRRPHAGDMAPAPLGIPWAEKWLAIRSCGSVAIRTLLAVSGGGNRATATSNLLPVARHYLFAEPSVAPIHPPDEPARKPRPSCWGFRLVIHANPSAAFRLGCPSAAI